MKVIKCVCGGPFKEKCEEIHGIKCDVMVCSSCKEKVFTIEQSKKYHKTRFIQN
jgi:hypothetical protein